MLLSTSHELMYKYGGEQGPITNALIESFVIHLRNVIDFLYNDRPKSDDVIAADYFHGSDKCIEIRPVLSESLKKAKRRAHKEVAHLTYERLKVTPETKPWQFITISDEIRTVFGVFIKNVSKDKLHRQWKNHTL